MKSKKQFAKIYLVRHGEVNNNRNIIYGYSPLPLSKKARYMLKKSGSFNDLHKVKTICDTGSICEVQLIGKIS